jgi:hypothetical protein
LDREAQNRSRGDFSSQRFQGFQGGGFDHPAVEVDLGGDVWWWWRISQIRRRWRRIQGPAVRNLSLEFTSIFHTTKTQPTYAKQTYEKTININRYRQYQRFWRYWQRPDHHWAGDVMAQKEALLTQSGFKIITVTAPAQQQAVSRLTVGRSQP